MKILIIHPEDNSTDFLTSIYDNLGGFPNYDEVTIVRSGLTKDEINKQIEKHDRIMMMGHGSPNGLFSVGRFAEAWGYVVDQTTVPLLQNKECIFIWCNADQFVNKHNLKGFYSGMFVSEVSEAAYCGMPNTPRSIVEESNDFFAKEFGLVSDKPLIEAYEYIKDVYGILTENNPVAKYNHYRLYLNS